MSLFDTKNTILVTCGRNTASFLAKELRTLGFPVHSELPFGVMTNGSLEDTMTLNLALRSAQRVLYRISEGKAQRPKEFYQALRNLPWENYIDSREYITVSSVVDTPSIRDSRFVNLTAKDAIVDRLSAERGQRPDSGPDRRGVVVHCYWKDDHWDLYFDTSGEPLHKRGYRVASVAAPLQETLAATLIRAAAWSGREHFINPLCGSGTFAIEAALMALHKAPGLLRSNFGFMHIRGYRASTWRGLRNEWNRKTKSDVAVRIIATDIDENAVEAARENARAAGVESSVEFAALPFQESPLPEGKSLIMMNPEYGKRLGEQRMLEGVYRSMGDFLKRRCAGSRAAVFTGNLTLARHIGLKTSRKMIFFNGSIECRLLCYDLYEGSRKRVDPDPAPPAM